MLLSSSSHRVAAYTSYPAFARWQNYRAFWQALRAYRFKITAMAEREMLREQVGEARVTQ